MTLQEIVDMSRYRLNNYEKPYHWVDSEMVLYVNRAVDIIARETKIIHVLTSPTICEIYTTAGTSRYALNSSILYIKSVKLVTKEILCLDVAPGTAWASGDTVTGASSTVTCTIDEYIDTTHYYITNRTGVFTAGEILSNGTYAADQGASYPNVYDYEYSDLEKASLEELEKTSDWRYTQEEPRKYCLDASMGATTATRYIYLYPNPDQVYMVRLAAMGYQAAAMTTTTMSSQTPGIDERYHDFIVDGVCMQAYQKWGDRTYDEKKSMFFYNKFYTAIAKLKIEKNLYEGIEKTIVPDEAFI